VKEPQVIKELFDNLINAIPVDFPRHGGVNESDEQGVYIIFSPDEKVLHVGKTDRGRNGLNQRLQNHINNQSSFLQQYLKFNGKVLRNGYKFRYIIEEDNRKRALLESLTTGLLCPAHIGTGERK
jgi:hypothetical protein